MRLAKVDPWLDLLTEVAGRMSDSQANVILRMVTAFREAISSRGSNPLNTIDVLNKMIDDSNAEIKEESDKAFWS